METLQPKTFQHPLDEQELLERIMARWRARLLLHGPDSDLGREARRQLFKLESRRNNLKWRGTPLNQKKRQQSSGGSAQHPA